MIGASEIVMAVKLRHEIKGEWFLILMGVASIVFAVLLLWNPVAGAAALIGSSHGTGQIRRSRNLFWLPRAKPAKATFRLKQSNKSDASKGSEDMPVYGVSA